MSKLAIGCVGLLAVGIVGGAGGSYYAYRKVASVIAPVADLASVADIDRSIRKQGTYAPPASGEPSRAQVDRLLQVQEAVRARLGTRADDFYQKYRRYFELTDGERPQIGGVADSAMVAFRMSVDLAGMFMDGKRAQVDALNRLGMSLDEYRWTRSRVYSALDMPFTEIDIPAIVAEVKAGRQPTPRSVDLKSALSASPAVRKMVEPHRQTLEHNVGLAFFGL
jgi:hypothetical protein